VVLTAAEIREALDEVVTQMIDSVKECLAVTPPELAQDLLMRGIYLVGGGALLTGPPRTFAVRNQSARAICHHNLSRPSYLALVTASRIIKRCVACFMDARR